jgi:F-type H+-transporting ATPase subunit alpha
MGSQNDSLWSRPYPAEDLFRFRGRGFGARLEASIEAKIKRGRILREILKQDRLSPLPIEFQLAWLVAFNEGLLDHTAKAQIPTRLNQLADTVRGGALGLEDKRETWKRAIRDWLGSEE